MPDRNSTPATPVTNGNITIITDELTEANPTVTGSFVLNSAANLFRLFGNPTSEDLIEGGTLTSIQMNSDVFSVTATDGVGGRVTGFSFGSDTIDATFSSPDGEFGTFTFIAQTRTLYSAEDELILSSDETSEWISGLEGDDYFVASAGFDIYEGGAGFDTLDYADSTSAITLNLVDTANIFSGSIFFGRFNAPEIYSFGGLAEGHLIYGVESFIGSDFDDTFNGSSRDEVFEGGDGADTFNGGGGEDFVSYENASESVTVSLLSGVTSGAATGDSFNEIEGVIGTTFADTLTGDAGSNFFRGLGGEDVIDGGAGIDTVSFIGSTVAGVVLDFAADVFSGLEGTGTYTNIENFEATDFDDTVISGTDAINVSTVDGDDNFDLSIGSGHTADAGDGTDSVTFTGRTEAISITVSNTLRSDDGSALTGFEVITLTAQDDTVELIGIPASGVETIDAGAGTDTLIGTFNRETDLQTGQFETVLNQSTDLFINFENYTGGFEAELIFGTSGANVISGEEGDDSIEGRAGADVINGGTGLDTSSYVSSTEAVTVNLNTGLGAGGDAEGDTLTNIENLTGSGFDDDLSGNDAANILIGAAGNDILIGDGVRALSLGSLEGQLFRAYQAVFDRSPDPSGFDTFLTELRLGNLDQQAVIGQFVESAEFQNTYGNLSSRAFMEQLYLNVLDREGDMAGLDLFTGELDGGRSRSSVVVEFANSPEFLQLMTVPSAAFATNVIIDPAEAQVFRIYQAVFLRDPDEGGFTAFTNSVQSGTLTVEAITAEFVASQEFQDTYGALSNEAFVELLFTNVLPGNQDQNGRDAFTAALDAGTLTQAGMVAEFVDSFEFVQRMSGPAADFVATTYSASADVLDGGAGSDVLFGGRGADEFVYDTEAGDADIILDFTSGTDSLDLGDNADFDTFAEIMAAGSQAGLDAVFDFGDGSTLTLEGVVLSELTEDDFGLGDGVGNSKPSDAVTAVITQFPQVEVEVFDDLTDFELYDMFG